MQVSYIIVGLGLAGLSFIEKLTLENKNFIVFEDNSQTSSLVAGGVYNPVILKRFTPVWNAKEQLKIALPFYEELSKKLETEFDQKLITKKAFKSIKDQNNWFAATDKPSISEFLDSSIEHQKKEGIVADFGFGNVFCTGRIDTKKLIETYREHLKITKNIRFEKFEYQALKMEENGVVYKDVTASKIVFCEGFGIKQNPFFNKLPLKEAKGELLQIHAPKLNIDFLLKSTLFVLPMGDDIYKVGATFNWIDKTSNPTEDGRNELVEKLQKVIDVPYTIVGQNAGIRPTVKDRRPLIGVHSEYKNLAVLNGLGTRGVMIAPLMAQKLFNHIEKNTPLDAEIDISRFEK